MTPFLDLQSINAKYRAQPIDACTRVIDSGWYIGGKELTQFEEEFAAYCGTTHCIGVANGLDALILSLRAWLELGRLQPGDEIIMPAKVICRTEKIALKDGSGNPAYPWRRHFGRGYPNEIVSRWLSEFGVGSADGSVNSGPI